MSNRQRARLLGFRSGLETRLQQMLSELSTSSEYEKHKIKYQVPASIHSYTPDFFIPVSNIFIESKGRFMPADMKKHLLIKEQHPELDIRFIFQNSNATNSKRSKTTYANWCNKHGFKYCDISDRSTIERWCRERADSTVLPEEGRENGDAEPVREGTSS